MSADQNHNVLCFGEVLWDCLPHGRFAGGAPLNVAYHLNKLGVRSWPISCVGADTSGDDLLLQLMALGLPIDLVNTRTDKATGVVYVMLDDGMPSYTIVDDVAWDCIDLDERLLSDCEPVSAIVFGTLAQRHEHNQTSLTQLFERAPDALKVLDVNLRPPFDTAELVWELADRADIVKLNREEATELTKDCGATDVEQCARTISVRSNCDTVCVTCGAAGAGMLTRETWHWVDAQPVVVRDTIGAGDAFLAALVNGLLTAPSHPNQILAKASRLAGFVASCESATPNY